LIAKGNKLTSFVGCPLDIIGFFDCSNNKLTSLVQDVLPVVGGNFSCSHNDLPSEIIGALEHVGVLNEEQMAFLYRISLIMMYGHQSLI
jgi:hypothetical protein